MNKVEMLVQVCINGRPIWRKAKPMRAEMSERLTDKEYARVIDSAVERLAVEIRDSKKKKEATAA